MNVYAFKSLLENNNIPALRGYITANPACLTTVAANGWNALHLAICWGTVDRAKISVMIEMNPESLRVVTNGGDLPLHQAARNSSSTRQLDVLQLLIEEYPAAMSIGNNLGNLPVHNAIINMNHAAATLLLPPTAETAEKGNGEPLLQNAITCWDWACTRDDQDCPSEGETAAYVDFLKGVFEKYPNAAQIVDQYGNLPLHTACKCNASLEVMDLLLKHYRNGLATYNIYGKLPFHMACSFSKDGVLIDHLVKKLKWGVALPRTTHGTHALELARLNTNDNGAAIYTLLRHHPHLNLLEPKIVAQTKRTFLRHHYDFVEVLLWIWLSAEYLVSLFKEG